MPYIILSKFIIFTSQIMCHLLINYHSLKIMSTYNFVHICLSIWNGLYLVYIFWMDFSFFCGIFLVCAVLDLMGKQFWVSGKSASIFVGVNESLSLSSLTSQTVGTHFIWNQANNSFFVMLHSKVSMLREFKNTNSQENSTKKWKIHSEDVN
jgi:hypothetical protein